MTSTSSTGTSAERCEPRAARAGMTVAVLAAMMRVVPDQLVLAEMGKRRFTPSQVTLAALALRVPAEAFYEGLEGTLNAGPRLRPV